MKKTILMIALCAFIISSFAQTITWKKVASLPEAYGSGEAVTLNNKIYFVAGRTSRTCPYFYEYDPKINTWKKLANIPNPTTNLALAAVNGKIYAIGGDQFQDTNREYNPKTNTWKLLKPMPTARQHIDCGIYEDKIYITGGLTSWENITTKHEVYDVSSNTWTEKAAIPGLRQNAAVVTVDSLIYVIGGSGTKNDIWGDLLTVETYNIKSDKWTRKNDLPQILFKPAAVVINKQIIALGGATRIGGKDQCSDKIFIYKPETDQWVKISNLPVKNVFFGCTSIDNKIYVIGGTNGGHPSWANYSEVYEGEIIKN